MACLDTARNRTLPVRGSPAQQTSLGAMITVAGVCSACRGAPQLRGTRTAAELILLIYSVMLVAVWAVVVLGVVVLVIEIGGVAKARGSWVRSSSHWPVWRASASLCA